MNTPNWFVTSEFSREMGGAAKTIRLFQSSLGGRIVSIGGRAEPGERDVEIIRAKQTWWGKRYGTPLSTSLEESLLRIGRPCELVSIHLLFRYHCGFGRKKAIESGCPYWVVPHGALDPWVFSYRGAQKRFWMRTVGGQLLREASAVVFATRREAEKASQVCDIQNPHVINWPVRRFEPQDATSVRESVRGGLGISADTRVLLYLGRLHSMKRPVETILAYARSDPPSDSALILVGNEGDVSIEELESVIPDRLRDQVHVVGPKWGQDRDAFLVASDGFVSLSHRENFGHTAGEAMAAGLPLVLSPGNDLAGEFGSHDAGTLLESLDDDEVTEAFRWFFSAPRKTLRRIGEANRDWTRGRLGIERFQRELLSLHQAGSPASLSSPRGEP